MNNNLKTLASASIFALFIFIAYGSDDEKTASTTDDAKTNISNLTQAQKIV
ncbi:hypothetical protein [Chryseobacterium sp. 3008163]|uniref:hypothetical protein n=1 Tax=Chryseobacterium sp. 3008163 TaxID=2478663 RepID=UPI0013E9BA66|nr:hypothetical protein [Chryseobacterium sp. 3008163]